jgi:phosphoserine phosphatase RsbU/P
MLNTNHKFKGFLNKTKYRTILLSAALFLTFDLGVLLPNIVVSSQLKRDAVKINLAGRQRMLSQRITKALLQVKSAQQSNQGFTRYQDELALTSKLFDDTLLGFDVGKQVSGGNGNPVYLEAVEGEKAKGIISQAKEIWTAYKQKISLITASKDAVPPNILDDAIAYADQNNLKLLDLMNQLTTEQQNITDTKANTLQVIQTIGLFLALINFFVLLSHSLRKLKEGDAQIEKASAEIAALNEQLKQDNIRMKNELDITREIQRLILPTADELAQIPDLDVAGFMQPASEVGGDYYDVVYHNGQVKIGIGDVTGHGLESGMLMLMVQTAVRTLLVNNETDPKKFLDTLNRTIYSNVMRMNSEKNMTLCLVDYHDGKIRVSGQHEEILIVRRGGLVQRVDTIDLGFPIGLEEDISQFIAYADIQIYPGDAVVLYTDGITEAEDKNKVQYGIKRLMEVIKENWQQSAEEIKQAVVDNLWEHMGTEKPLDDITLVVLKRKRLTRG